MKNQNQGDSSSVPLKVDDFVYIVEGTYENFHGTIMELNAGNETAKICLNVFGGSPF
jgi:transcription antitermination factor NusG